MEAKTMNSREYLRRILDRELSYLTIYSFNIQRAVGQLNSVIDNCPYEEKKFECKYLKRTTERESHLLEMSFNEIYEAINTLKDELGEHETETPLNPELVRENSMLPRGEEESVAQNDDENKNLEEECGTQNDGDNRELKECNTQNNDEKIEFVEAILWSSK